jgi:hypothetical protein
MLNIRTMALTVVASVAIGAAWHGKYNHRHSDVNALRASYRCNNLDFRLTHVCFPSLVWELRSLH